MGPCKNVWVISGHAKMYGLYGAIQKCMGYMGPCKNVWVIWGHAKMYGLYGAIQKCMGYMGPYKNVWVIWSHAKCMGYMGLAQVQHSMDPLINMQKSVFLPLWENYQLYGRKILHIESFLPIESEHLVRISKFFI